ncbi:MAG: flagellar biosynthesis regulator FlaF [Marinosulfonomonas sp.]|nr:flagellar biosynthesis regulator FlaF [Marinosulfonomonas sp.]
MAQTAYTSSIAPVKTERGTEYDAFSHVTRALKATSEKSDYPAFIAALHENRKLWTLLAVDVADADNGLPRQLRAQLFYLAEFTQKHTSQIIAGRADSAPLIDVNTSVMRGLRHGRGGA